jgi:hypothetical protein
MDHFTALGKASKKMGHDHYMDVPDDKLEALKAMVKRFRAGEEVDESALQAYIGDKKYGKDGMDALRKAGQDDASEKTMQNIRAEYSDKEQAVAEEGSENKYSNLSNRGVNRGINRAGDDFNRMLDLDQAESPHYKTQHQQDTKQRLKTTPMAGPIGVLPDQGVAEGEFAGDYATGEAGQWRNKGPKANKPATIGDLVGEGQEDLAAMMRIVNR